MKNIGQEQGHSLGHFLKDLTEQLGRQLIQVIKFTQLTLITQQSQTHQQQ